MLSPTGHEHFPFSSMFHPGGGRLLKLLASHSKGSQSFTQILSVCHCYPVLPNIQITHYTYSFILLPLRTGLASRAVGLANWIGDYRTEED